MEDGAYNRPMAFDIQRAHAFSVSDDRDTALFFAGRDHEIQKFRDALDRMAPERRATVFRVFQGAPGCGKTSLLNHLMSNSSEDSLFIGIGKDDMASRAAMDSRVGDAIASAHSAGMRIAVRGGEDFAKRFKMDRFIDEAKKAYAEHKAKATRIVLYMDEAQFIEPSEKDGLRELHTNGLGFPSVLLLTGLGHTADKLSKASISGLSNMAVTNMGPLTGDQCAESTRKLLDEFGADGEREPAAEMVAGFAYGWPQHLCGAQQALCKELELDRVNGDLGKVDYKRVRDESDKNRRNYYDARLSGSALDMVPAATAQIVTKVRESRPRRMFDLEGVCENEIENMGLDKVSRFRTTPEEFSNALVERGVLAINPDGWYDVAIPSMAEWLRSKARRRPSGRGGCD